MNSKLSIKYFTFVTLLLALILALTSVVFAEETQTTTTQTIDKSALQAEAKERMAAEYERIRQEKLEQLQQKQQQLEEQRKQKQEAISQKLEAKKLEVCEKKEASINARMEKIAEQRAKQIDVFNKISERTQDFYTEKGLTVENYDSLVTTVNEKRAAAEAAVESIGENRVDFSCDSEDPLGVAEAFKTAREDLMTAMKEYKTSVKDLIVGVKTAAEAADDSSEAESAEKPETEAEVEGQ